MHNVQDVSNYIIAKCGQLGKPICNQRLQKLLYFSQAEFLVVKDHALFSEEIEAWDSGPVVPKVYNNFKAFLCPDALKKNDELNLFKPDEKALIDEIINECSKYSTMMLIRITQNQSPIKNAAKTWSRMVDPNEIKRYFKEV